MVKCADCNHRASSNCITSFKLRLSWLHRIDAPLLLPNAVANDDGVVLQNVSLQRCIAGRAFANLKGLSACIVLFSFNFIYTFSE